MAYDPNTIFLKIMIRVVCVAEAYFRVLEIPVHVLIIFPIYIHDCYYTYVILVKSTGYYHFIKKKEFPHPHIAFAPHTYFRYG